MAHSSSLTSGILEKHPSARICTLSMVQTNKADGNPTKKAITRDMTLQPPESEKSAVKNSTKSTTKEWNEHLVTLGAHQDRKAFKALFDHFSPLLKNYFIGKYPTQSSYQMIEELIQEVMIKVWQKASSYDPSKAAASTWIFTLARNTRIDMLRRQNKYANTTSIETEEIWEDTTENGPYTFLTQKRDESLIKQKLLALPDEQQIVIRKVYMEAKSHTEVATELQLPLGTVKSRVRLAQKKLQAMLQDTKQHEM
ncbi:sigma-24 (FecI-like) [gamma proteobacterium IMCC1989]|nr:sigma-24 (FecI-like) [gamma proteobacterium IMCC1989]